MKHENGSAQNGQDGKPMPLTFEENQGVTNLLRRLETVIRNRGTVFCFFSDDALGESGMFLEPDTVMSDDRLSDNLLDLLNNNFDEEGVRYYRKLTKLLANAGTAMQPAPIVESEDHQQVFTMSVKSFHDLMMSEIEKVSTEKELKEDLMFVINATMHILTLIYGSVFFKNCKVTNNGQFVSAVMNAFIHLDFIRLDDESKIKLKQYEKENN